MENSYGWQKYLMKYGIKLCKCSDVTSAEWIIKRFLIRMRRIWFSQINTIQMHFHIPDEFFFDAIWFWGKFHIGKLHMQNRTNPYTWITI